MSRILPTPFQWVFDQSSHTVSSVEVSSRKAGAACFSGLSVMAVVSRRCMINLSGDLGQTWRMFGYRTHLNKVVTKIQEDYSNDTVEQGYQILKAWKQFYGSKATYEALGGALRLVERTDLAERYSNGGMYIRSHRRSC